MNNVKQVMTKPQKKVGAHEKGRTEEGKGGEPAVPRRRTCAELAPPNLRRQISERWVLVRSFGSRLNHNQQREIWSN